MSEYIDNYKAGIILNKCDKNEIAKAMEKMKSNLDDMINVTE